jgi:hypothetical protein
LYELERLSLGLAVHRIHGPGGQFPDLGGRMAKKAPAKKATKKAAKKR